MNWLFILAFLLISTIAKAQVKISGKITDSHNKVLSGISVSIQNSYDGAMQFLFETF